LRKGKLGAVEVETGLATGLVPVPSSLDSVLTVITSAYIAGTNGYSNGIVPMLRAFELIGKCKAVKERPELSQAYR
jgi:hypothetical protein